MPPPQCTSRLDNSSSRLAGHREMAHVYECVWAISCPSMPLLRLPVPSASPPTHPSITGTLHCESQTRFKQPFILLSPPHIRLQGNRIRHRIFHALRPSHSRCRWVSRCFAVVSDVVSPLSQGRRLQEGHGDDRWRGIEGAKVPGQRSAFSSARRPKACLRLASPVQQGSTSQAAGADG